MDIKDHEEILFADWARKRPGFIKDGVVNEVEYEKSMPRIVFVLKEINGINDKDGFWEKHQYNLCCYLRKGAKAQTWNNIARWVYGIRRLYQDKQLQDDVWRSVENISNEFRREQLNTICVVNIKKTAGASVTNRKELAQFHQEDLNLIKRQIDIYKPELIINCSKVVLNMDGGAPVIDFYHPQARLSKRDMFAELMDKVAEHFA